MAQTHTDTNVNQLIINKLTKQEYDNLSQVSETELYLVEEPLDNVVTQNSTNPVQSGAVYNAIQQAQSQQVQSDWNQSNNSAVDYIKNKPTIPEVNNATLTIQKNGTTVKSFTANASNNVTCNITVPTKTSDLDNDSGYITSSSLPTVNNATLTIQRNGTNVQTFTANASANKTANITVPTKTSELTNDSGFITSHQDISGKVNKSGDTMTGNLTISKPTGNVSNILQSPLLGDLSTLFTITSSGSHGIYSNGYYDGTEYQQSGKWLVVRDSSNNIKINGTLTCPNKTGTLATLDDIASDTNTWRKVQLNGTDKLGTGTSSNPLNLKAGTNVSITESSGTFTFAATDTKNTAGSTDTSSKIYLIGATSQADSYSQTYSDDQVYVENGSLYLTKTTDASGDTDNKPALMVGDPSDSHIEIDGNEIMAKSSATTTGTLYINNNGGQVNINGKPAGKFNATPTSGNVVIADGTDGGMKTSSYTIAKSVPSDAVFTDTGATSVGDVGSGNVVNTASYSSLTRRLSLIKDITTLVAGTEGEIAIIDNSDLNDYTTAGTYGTTGGHGESTTAASLVNKPTFAGGFRMYVESCGGDGTYIRQTIITKAGLTFIRTGNLNNSTWNTWEQVASVSDLPDISTKVSKSGDTMTGNLQITKETGQVYTRLSSTACDGLSTLLTVTSTGGHGVYSEGYWNGESYTASGKWLVSRDSSNVVKLNGTLTCPNKTGIIATLDDIVSDTDTTYTFASGDSNGQIKVTPSSGSAYNVNVKGLESAAYTDKQNYWMIGKTSTSIPASSTNTVDLNTYVTPGNYYCGPNTNAAYVTNHPSPSSHPSFNLIVSSSINSLTYIRQIVLCYNSNDLWMRYTTDTGATWSSWRNLAKDTTYSAGTGLTLNSTTFSVTYGTSANTACQGNDSRLSDARTPTNHASNKVTSLTGYSKPSSTSAITTSDSLNVAIGKLEKGLENAISGNPSVGWTRTISIVDSTVSGLESSCNGYGRVCCGYVHFKKSTSNNSTVTILRIPNVQASHHVIFPALLNDGEAHIELRIVSDLEKSYTDIQIWGNGPSIVANRYYTGHFSFITT